MQSPKIKAVLKTSHFDFSLFHFLPTSTLKGEYRTMKRYYLCSRGNTTHIWHCSHETMSSTISRSYNLILPLDRKPRNREIREG